MNQLREFAQHADEFQKLNVHLVAISVDDQEHAHMAWEKKAGRKFIILSDPGAAVIRQYGLLHAQGKGDTDIAIRTTFLIDENGRERWRRVSTTVLDIPKSVEVLAVIRSLH